jgi:hypothetical protein
VALLRATDAPMGASAVRRNEAAEKRAEVLRALRNRAIWVGIALFLAFEAAGEVSRMRRNVDRSVNDWSVGAVRRAERETRGEGLAVLARWVSRTG